jgi:hypothetical protein
MVLVVVSTVWSAKSNGSDGGRPSARSRRITGLGSPLHTSEEHLDGAVGQANPAGAAWVVRNLLVSQSTDNRGEHVDVSRVVDTGGA